MSVATIIDPNTGKIAAQYSTPGAQGPAGPAGPVGPQGPPGPAQGPIIAVNDPTLVGPGTMGSILQQLITTAVPVVPNVVKTVASVNLSAGVWVVFGTIQLNAVAPYCTAAAAGLSADGGTIPPIPYRSEFYLLTQAGNFGYSGISLTAPTQYITVPAAASQTISLQVRFQNNGDNPGDGSATGFIQAVRVA